MENINIEPTKKSLEVECTPGYFKLSGNSILSDPRKFFKPIVEWVEEYIKEKPLRVVAEKFIDFYESKGWMVGKNKMKDWKAACRMSADWDSMLQAWTAKHGGGGTSVRPEHEKYNRKLRRNRPKSGSSGGEAETQKDDLGELQPPE